MAERDLYQPESDQPESTQPKSAPPGPRNGWLSWLLLFVLGTASISLAAVYLPPRVKMLGLFAVGIGLLAGGLAAWLARVFELRSPPSILMTAAAFLVILGGQVGMALESHRVFRTAEERALAANPKRAAVLRMLQSGNLPDDAKSEKMAADVRKTIGTHGTSFTDYLRYRLSELGVQSGRAAWAIWILEIALGSLAGTWIFRRFAGAPRLDASVTPAKLDE
jgi:hypothetical protein